ncbi:uncharacterized protein LOC105636022 isoform X2 [Jatropha curcas]|uniref:uncharacterized protein LOC105636022 isoform X2 n=1 Tax=Jatropha curcas TaxID=180498 RepID=UPI0018937B9E|nr:uncharacterized protein LOC105636022 isoform X2 [Jatropha curcas]
MHQQQRYRFEHQLLDSSSMALSTLSRKWRWKPPFVTLREASILETVLGTHGFRSVAALEAIAKAREEKVPNMVLYNYPSFSGAFSAAFARIFHSRLNLPSLILPFSSIEPLRIGDLNFEGLERCYLLDFLGPPGFASSLARQSMVIGFDHRKSVLSKIPSTEDCEQKITFYVDIEKSSSTAVYEYFSNELVDMKSSHGEVARLLNPEEQVQIEDVLEHIEDVDLRRWSLPDIGAFNMGLSEWRSKINCVTNPHMFEKLLEISSSDLIAKGNSYFSSRQSSASKLLDKAFKVRLGRGFYGECLGVRADGYSNLADEIGRQLSVKSAAAGLRVYVNFIRPIGVVIYMQRNNLKMCLRSADTATDTSEIAKAYGGGGSLSSSSFIIRMDEYNQWLSNKLS